MPSPDLLMLMVAGPVLIAGGAAALLLVYLVVRDPGGPTTPEWAPGQLARIPELPLRPAGLHRAEGARACDLVSANVAYEPRHGFEEVPPSLVVGLSLMDPVRRARELVRQLGAAGWWPWADQPDCRLRLRLRARAIARRHGLQPLLGTFQLQGVLP